jgi:tetratricopeptide (TPR) repeat protein
MEVSMPARSAPALRAGTLLILLALLSPGALAAPTVKFDLADGATVSDVITIVVRASGASDINKVDFTVDGQAKATSTSVPYSFTWDTLNETEGEHTIGATATDEKGETGSATLKVVVDNELSKGADYHADAALAAIKAGDVKLAAARARRALKIDPANLRAARALAGIYRQQGELDRAVEVLEKANIPDSDTEARADLVALHILKADAAESSADFLKEADAAMAVYRQLQAARAAAAKGGTGPTAAIKRGDIEFAARNWQAAVDAYQSCGSPEDAPMEAVNRLALTFMSAGRMKEADVLLKQLARLKRADAVTRSLQGLFYLYAGQIDRVGETVQEGVENNLLPALLVASYADLASKQGRRAGTRAEQAFSLAPELPEVLLLRAYVLPDPLDARKALTQALERNPLLPEAYALHGYQTMLTRDAKRFQAAEELFAFALKIDPKNHYALMGDAIALIGQNRPNDADPMVAQLAAQAPDAPDVHVLKALLYRYQDKSLQITAELEAARKFDEVRWNFVFVPTPDEMARNVYRYLYSPALTPACLYPAK